jgi:hypothetical protein
MLLKLVLRPLKLLRQLNAEAAVAAVDAAAKSDLASESEDESDDDSDDDSDEDNKPRAHTRVFPPSSCDSDDDA